MPGFEAENRAMRRLATVIAMVVLLSVATVAAAEQPARVKANKSPEAKAFLGARPANAGGPDTASFSKQVAPILSRHCGGCHMSRSRGGFQMTSYEGLMKTGVVQKGMAGASRLIEVIESGDMPRGGGKVPPADLATLKRWIDAGAGCDVDPAAGIAEPAGTAAGAPPAAIPIRPAALNPGDVSFAYEVAPVLLKNCSGCHDDDRPEEGFSVTTFARLMRGGESGPAILAGKGADSLLVRKIKGMNIEGQRMPIGKPPLPAETIAIVEKWIDQGASLDLLSSQERLSAIASAGRMRSMSHEELSEFRLAAARKLWRRAIPDEDPAVEKRGDLLVVGNLEPAQTTLAADAAATAWAKVQRLLADGQKPLVKGGTVVYVFAKPFDYSAFWQVLLADERPKGLRGNAGVIDEIAYGALVMPEAGAGGKEGDFADDLEALTAEQLAAAAFLVRGAPAWFASGAGRMVAMKVAPKAPVLKAWRSETAEQLQRLGGAPDDYLGDQADPVAVAAIGGGFVPAFVRSEAKLAGLIKSLDAGATFDKAFAEAFKESPQAIYAWWAGRASKKMAGSGRR